MAATGAVTGNVSASVTMQTVKTSGLPSGMTTKASETFPFPQFAFLSSGVGLNQCDQAWKSGARALAASTSESLDLAGSLTDEYGNTITFARVKLLAIYNRGAAKIKVGIPAANGLVTMFPTASSHAVIDAGGFLLLACNTAAGYAVTAATGDLIQVTNLDGAVAASYDIGIWGGTT